MKKVFLSAIALLAAVTLSAQDLSTVYNEAVAAFSAKNFSEAIPKFEQVITEGDDDEMAMEIVEGAKKALPICYQNLGTRAAAQKNFDEAIVKLSKGAELAQSYGDERRMNTINTILAKVYQVQGGVAFNEKDYATAAEIFAKGYAANPRNTEMALNLAMSYSESGDYAKGMDVYEDIIALGDNPKYAEAVAKAQEMMALYTNNEVAKLQAANDYDGIITMADALLAKNPVNPLAEKVRLQAYASKKDYDKVIELGEAAAAAQTDPEDKSLMYFTLGAAYNAKEMKPQAIASFRQVTAGPAAASAKAALAELTK